MRCSQRTGSEIGGARARLCSQEVGLDPRQIGQATLGPGSGVMISVQILI